MEPQQGNIHVDAKDIDSTLERIQLIEDEVGFGPTFFAAMFYVLNHNGLRSINELFKQLHAQEIKECQENMPGPVPPDMSIPDPFAGNNNGYGDLDEYVNIINNELGV